MRLDILATLELRLMTSDSPNVAGNMQGSMPAYHVSD